MLTDPSRPSISLNAPIHHLALLVDDLEQAMQFYETILGLSTEKRWSFPDGSLRSIWLSLGANTRLMLEKNVSVKTKPPGSGDSQPQPNPQGDKAQDPQGGWHLLALTISLSQRDLWKEYLEKSAVILTGESNFSLYIQDPEGNKIALSHWPDELAQRPSRPPKT